MLALDYVLKGCAVYCDGFGKAGTAEKITIPPIKKKSESFRGGGMIGSRKMSLGYDDMEFDFTLNAFDPQVLKLAGVSKGATVAFAIRGYFVGDLGKEHTAVYMLSGEIMELDGGSWESGKKAELKIKVSLVAQKLTIDNSEIFDIDIPNGIDSWGGVDNGASMRAALGLAG